MHFEVAFVLFDVSGNQLSTKHDRVQNLNSGGRMGAYGGGDHKIEEDSWRSTRDTIQLWRIHDALHVSVLVH